MTAPAVDTPEATDTPAHVERLGRWRASELLTELTGQQLWPSDITDLADADVLAFTDEYEGNPLVDVADLHTLAAREDFTELLAEHRLLAHAQAAAWLRIRPTDLRYVVEAGWLEPHRIRKRQVGRVKVVSFPVYHVSQLAALLELPDVDWDAVRAATARQRSPLRKFVTRPPSRAQVVHMFCARMRRRHRVEVWPWWHNGRNVWFIDWETRNGAPTRAQLDRALVRDKALRPYVNDVIFGSEAGMVTQWARQMMVPGASVVLDTETTDLFGPVCEVAVTDPVTREVLLDTLVNPGAPIEPGAQAVHGISDEMVATAPTFDQVWPQLLAAVGDRIVLAYNSSYDFTVITDHARALGIDPGRLADPDAWNCLMWQRSAWHRTSRRMRLEGGHRAAGDTLKACEVLAELTELPPKR